MPLVLWNTLTKRKEPFQSLEPGVVRMYTCGPTVYSRPHIGNYASFLMADLLRRWLEVSGFRVLHVKNITDVGHLVADADSGEDKVEREARAEKEDDSSLRSEDVLAVARKYEEQYLEDEQALNFLPPLARPRATETIPEMLALIQALLQKGHAYETEDGVYFFVQSFPRYGELSGNTLANLTNLDQGVRVEVKETKRHPADFALWKKRVGEHTSHVLHWSSPWGEGFPGWHIECSAMSRKHLGDRLDIHTGGEDNIFPHHECEIAQSEGATDGKPFSRFFLHRRRLNLSDAKMSKSLGNIVTLPEIISRGFSPLDLRFFLLQTHYRSHASFSFKALEDAKKARARILAWMLEAEEGRGVSWSSEVADLALAFRAALDDDLNTPAALGSLFALMAASRKNTAEQGQPSLRAEPAPPALPKPSEGGSLPRGPAGSSKSSKLILFLDLLERTFGCFPREKAEELPEAVWQILEERDAARRAGDFALSDLLRKDALRLGFMLEDTPEGTRAVRKGG